MILPSSCRPHTHQFPHCSHHAGPSDPTQQVAIYETCGTAIEETEDEDTEESFPGYRAAACKAEDGGAREITLKELDRCVGWAIERGMELRGVREEQLSSLRAQDRARLHPTASLFPLLSLQELAQVSRVPSSMLASIAESKTFTVLLVLTTQEKNKYISKKNCSYLQTVPITPCSLGGGTV